MTFEEALQAMREGKRVRVKSWSNKHYYYEMRPTIIDCNSKPVDAIESPELFKTDWEIVT